MCVSVVSVSVSVCMASVRAGVCVCVCVRSVVCEGILRFYAYRLVCCCRFWGEILPATVFEGAELLGPCLMECQEKQSRPWGDWRSAAY